MMATSYFLVVLLCLWSQITFSKGIPPGGFLSLGDDALSQNLNEKAIELYKQGIEKLDEDESLIIELSLFTNMGSALSAIGKNEEAAEAYQKALVAYTVGIEDVVDENFKKEATVIAAQSSFYLGMVYQDLGTFLDAIDAYAQAESLDPYHWGAAANLAGILHDNLSKHKEALIEYNRAYEILTQKEVEPTDSPPEPRYVLSQLKYRIGLCISHDLDAKCAMEDAPDKEIPCKELAAQAFAAAVEFDPENQSARHMLATITADATMRRASNTYVKSLFDDYAQNFEHSLVQELGYTGYERLRKTFDRAFNQNPPKFPLVIDAGCGTGLVGEQFRNVSIRLIGIDLSKAIILEAQKARPGLYDDVRVGDITEVFREMKPVSLIVAADSYIYFGDLEPLFESMEDSLGVGGYVAFTVENIDKESEKALQASKPDWRWQLTASGRFAHRKEYVETTGEAHNLQTIHYEPLDGFRYERGVPVRGHAFIMQKVSKDQEL